MCYFEDCEDRYWPPEEIRPTAHATATTAPTPAIRTRAALVPPIRVAAIFVSATATTVRTEPAARPGIINPAKAYACITLLIPISMHGQQNPRSYLSEPTAKRLPFARAALISAFAPAPIPRSAAVYASSRPILRLIQTVLI